jgi:TRAP transporter TAXI family solute receptor
MLSRFAIKPTALCFALCFSASTLSAQEASLATSSPGGTVYNLGLAIAEAGAESEFDIRVTPFTSTTQAIPVVASGQVTFGLANAYELAMADTGTVSFEGSPIDGLRIVSALYPMRMGLMVRADSDIYSLADMTGRNVPSGFGSTATGELLIGAMLASGGLSYEDVNQINVASFGDMAAAFEAGRTDAMIGVLGSGRDARIAENVGGVRILGLGNDAEAETRVQEFVPVARIDPVLASSNILGVSDDSYALTYDYYIYTSEQTPDEVVAKALNALMSGKDVIALTVRAFADYSVDTAQRDIGIPFHPAALDSFSK